MSRLLSKKWDDMSFRQHKERIREMNHTLDVRAPRKFPHLTLSLKKIAIEEERQARYTRENQMLLEKIRNIVKNGAGNISYHSWKSKLLHQPIRDRRNMEIQQENLRIRDRVRRVNPVIQYKKMDMDYQHHRELITMIDSSVKDYPQGPRYKKDRSSRADSMDKDMSQTLDTPRSDHSTQSSEHGEEMEQTTGSGGDDAIEEGSQQEAEPEKGTLPKIKTAQSKTAAKKNTRGKKPKETVVLPKI